MNLFLSSFFASLKTTRIFLGMTFAISPIIIVSLFIFKLQAFIILLSCIIPLYALEFLFFRKEKNLGHSLFLAFLIYTFMPLDIPLYVPVIASVAVFLLLFIYKNVSLPFNIVALSMCLTYIIFHNHFSYDNFENQDFKNVLLHEQIQMKSTEIGMNITNTFNTALKYINLNIPNGYIDIFLFSKSKILSDVGIPIILFCFLLFYCIGYIKWYTTISYFFGFFIPVYIFSGQNLFAGDILLQIFSGSFLVGMFFIYNDINNLAIFDLSSIISAFITGMLVYFFRKHSDFLDGMPFAIVVGDFFKVLIDDFLFSLKRNIL